MYQNQFAETFSAAEVSLLNLYHKLKEKKVLKMSLKLSSKFFSLKKRGGGELISHFSSKVGN